MTLILGIESSCDETAASVVRDGCAICSNVVASQYELHEAYGGVVPEIASRAHLKHLTPVIDQAIKQAGCQLNELDAIAVGNRPGLIGSLIVGVSAAKTLAWSLNKPLIGIDHVAAHLYSATLDNEQDTKQIMPIYPAIGLVISGGHTSLYLLQSPLKSQLLGRTIDDAIGEAYDKAGTILKVGYPGGPKLDKFAQTGDASETEALPMSMLKPDSLDFSYSGLKTALLYRVRGQPQGRGKQACFSRDANDLTDQQRANFAAAFQKAAIGAVIAKTKRAYKILTQQNQIPKCIIVGGGVSANSFLRQQMTWLGEKLALPICLPPMDLCVDNAAMIAGLAHHRLIEHDFDDLDLPTLATTRL